MKDSNGGLGPNGAFALVASICAAASVAIVFIALLALKQITDGGMWAIAAMTMAPTTLGVGIAYFIHQSARATNSGARANGPAPRDDEGYREGWPT